MKAISLFSGCGGDTLGMINNGINVEGFIEINEDCIKSHNLNFKKCKLLGKDIRKISDDELKKYKGKIDIIFGGFPCKSFSNAGKKKSLLDSRGTLFREFIRVTKNIQPKWVIGENVKGILKRKNEDESKFVKDIIVESFEEINYTMYKPFILKASNYGIPQKRERCFFVGSREKYNFDVNKIYLKKEKEKSVEDILKFSLENALKIEDVTEIEYFIENLNNNSEPTGKPATNLMKCFNKKANHGFSYGRRSCSTYSEIINIKKPTKTIISSYGRMPRLFVPLKNKNGIYLREFTIDELKQIQGFPINFKLFGNKISQINQIGNAVPPKLVKIIIEYIITLITLM